MIPNFNKTFKKTQSAERRIPEAVMEYLNSTIPDGTKYVADNDGNITLVADGKPITIGGIEIEVPKELRKKEKSLTIEDVGIFSYNAQRQLKVSLKKEGYIVINGKEIPIEDLHRNIYQQIKYENMEWFFVPEPFPGAREITVSSEEYCRKLMLKRVPYPSLTEAHFATEEDKSLRIRMSVDEEKHSSFSITYNLNYAKTVREIVETISIFNAFADGEGYLMGEKLLTGEEDINNERFDNRTLEFWKKVLQLEDVLNIRFKPPKENPDFQTICDIEQLYQNLILKNPTREDRMITSISSEYKGNDIDKFQESIGKVLYFQYTGDLEFSIFDRTFSCPSIFGMFNCKLETVEQEKEKIKLNFVNESEEKAGYTSVLCFATQEELDTYCYGVDDNHAEELEGARHPVDYLKD